MRTPLTVLASAVGALALALMPALGAQAAPKSSSSMPTGNDVSWPQCVNKTPTTGPLPKGQAFAVVGVNGGLANDSNPCFAEQWRWAQSSPGTPNQPKAAVYVNTANPELQGSWWPTSDAAENGAPVSVPAGYGHCDGTASAACAYVYGWSKAYDDVHNRGVTATAGLRWWLDVETTNSWSSSNQTANRADLEAMTTVFRQAGGTVGIYSTRYQFGTIVGSVPSDSPLAGLDSWLAGASSAKAAQSACTSGALTPGSRVSLVQYVSGGFDYDVSCIG